MARSKKNKFVRITMGSVRAITSYYFLDLRQLEIDGLIDERSMTELEIARVQRDVIRPIIHYPFGRAKWT